MAGPSGGEGGGTLEVVAAGGEGGDLAMDIEEEHQEEESGMEESDGEEVSLPDRSLTPAQKSALREESEGDCANKRSRIEPLPDSPYSRDLMITGIWLFQIRMTLKKKHCRGKVKEMEELVLKPSPKCDL